MRSSTIGRERFHDCVLLVGTGLLLRVLLLLLFPEPYGNDSIGRLYFKDALFLSHWLPLAQSLVWMVTRVTAEVIWIRLLFALIGALSVVGFYLYLRLIVDRPAALFGGFLFTFNGLYVFLSLMPYQGPLFLGLYYSALAFLFSPPRLHSPAGSVLFGLAALTRYEAWFVIPLLGLWKLPSDLRSLTLGRTIFAALRVLLYFGWAPILWLLLSRLHWGEWSGFLFQGPNQSFYGWHPHFDPVWVGSYALRMLSWTIGFGSPLVLLAVWGAVRLYHQRPPMPESLRLLLVNAALVLFFFFFIIGREQETVFRFVLFPMSVALTLAALGVEPLLDWFTSRFGRSSAWMIALAAALLALAAGVRIQRVTADPEYRTPYQVAQFLEAKLDPGETALVIAKRSDDPTEAAPMGFQRIAAIAGTIRPRLVSSGLLPIADPVELARWARHANVRFIIRFTDFEPQRPADRVFSQWIRDFPERFDLVLETHRAQVYRITGWP